jgi:hypothetical protein
MAVEKLSASRAIIDTPAACMADAEDYPEQHPQKGH